MGDKKPQGKQTFALRVSHPGSDFSSCNTNHTQALGLVIRANLLLGLPESHAILEFPELRCSMCFLCFSCPFNGGNRDVSRPILGVKGCVLTFVRLFAS